MPSLQATAWRDDTSRVLAGRDGRLSSLHLLAVARVRGARCGIPQGPSLEGWQGFYQQAVSRRYFASSTPFMFKVCVIAPCVHCRTTHQVGRVMPQARPKHVTWRRW